MKEIKGHAVKTWYIININNCGFVEVGQVMTTGQDYLETFTNEEDYYNRLGDMNNII